jgi:hypothetical protein
MPTIAKGVKTGIKAKPATQEVEKATVVAKEESTDKLVNNNARSKSIKVNKTSAKKPTRHVKKNDEVPGNLDKDLANLVMLIRNNQAIRRYTSLYILHRFEEDGFIDEAKGGFVEFKWDKIRVTDAKKLSKEYAYTESWLITAVAFAHSRMMRDSQHILEEFTAINNIDVENIDVTNVKI